jgi:Cyclin, C-terminal domain
MEDKVPPLQEDLVYISDHSFTSNMLRSLETRICKELSFRLHLVTPLHFINEFLRASHACASRSCQFDHPVLRQIVLYLLELGRLSFELTSCKPSLLAAAAVYLGRVTLGLREKDPQHAVDLRGYWTKTLQYQTGYTVNDLEGTVLMIHKYQHTAEASMNASFAKFSKKDRRWASLKTVPTMEDLGYPWPNHVDEAIL